MIAPAPERHEPGEQVEVRALRACRRGRSRSPRTSRRRRPRAPTRASSTGTPGAPGRQPCPTARPVAHVEGDRDPVRAVGRDEATREAPGRASAAVPTTARAAPAARRRGDGRLVAEAAGDLDARPLPHPGHDRRDHVELAGRRIAGTVEVDDVEPARAVARRSRSATATGSSP